MAEVNIEEKSVADLRYIAQVMGFSGCENMARDELIKLISGSSPADGASNITTDKKIKTDERPSLIKPVKTDRGRKTTLKGAATHADSDFKKATVDIAAIGGVTPLPAKRGRPKSAARLAAEAAAAKAAAEAAEFASIPSAAGADAAKITAKTDAPASERAKFNIREAMFEDDSAKKPASDAAAQPFGDAGFKPVSLIEKTSKAAPRKKAAAPAKTAQKKAEPSGGAQTGTKPSFDDWPEPTIIKAAARVAKKSRRRPTRRPLRRMSLTNRPGSIPALRRRPQARRRLEMSRPEGPRR